MDTKKLLEQIQDNMDFVEAVFGTAEDIDTVLSGRELKVCVPALALVMGTTMSHNLVGQMPGCETLESTVEMITGSILAAYRDAERQRREIAS